MALSRYPIYNNTRQDTGLYAVSRYTGEPVAPQPEPQADPVAQDASQALAAPTQAPAQATPAPAPAASTGLDTRALGGLDQVLQQTQQQQTQTQSNNQGLHDILLQQLQGLSRPVSMTDPTLSGMLNANRLTAQRAAERQRSALAERRAAQGLSSSGAFDAGLMGIEQGRAENEFGANQAVLGGELQQRRASLQSLLSQALALGDQDSARNIATQLQILGQQLQQSNAYDQSGFNYAALQAQLNGQTMAGILGAV